jgi:hypothetical protein
MIGLAKHGVAMNRVTAVVFGHRGQRGDCLDDGLVYCRRIERILCAGGRWGEQLLDD